MFTLITDGNPETFENRVSLLSHLRDKAAGETMYIDDFEIKVEDLVDTATDAEVIVECAGEYSSVIVLEAE